MARVTRRARARTSLLSTIEIEKPHVTVTPETEFEISVCLGRRCKDPRNAQSLHLHGDRLDFEVNIEFPWLSLSTVERSSCSCWLGD